jgi:hypothetical protein|tara:strand:+ start:11915 stop:12394 length:480 start_codon:yes stop_codon:yes gene_type:complete
MSKYNFESAKGRFSLFEDVRAYPRQNKSPEELDSYGVAKTESMPRSNTISTIGFVWNIDGQYSLTSSPEGVLEDLKEICSEFPDSPLNHNHFYLLENDNGSLKELAVGTLILGPSYGSVRNLNAKSNAPKLRLSSKVGSSTQQVKVFTPWIPKSQRKNK